MHGSQALVLGLFSFLGVMALQSPLQVQALDWKPDGSQLAAGFADGSVEILDSQAQRLTSLNSDTNVVSVRWSPDGSKLAFANAYGDIWISDTIGGQTAPINNEDEFVHSIDWSSDSSRLAAASQSGMGPAAHNRIQIWDVATGQLLTTIEEDVPDFYLNSLSWNPSNSNQIAAGSANESVAVWDIQTGATLVWLSVSEDPRISVTSIEWKQDGTRLAAGATDGTVWIWNTTTWQPTTTDLGGIINCVAWSSDGRLAAADGSIIRILNSETGQITLSVQADSLVYALAWHPDGSKLAYGGLTYSGRNGSVQIISTPQTTLPTRTDNTAIPTTASTGSVSAQATLRDALAGESCPAACFLGIMPGVTTRLELENILNGLNIVYDAAPLGPSGSIISYLFNPNSISPFIVNERDAAAINVGVDIVADIRIPITGVSVQDIVSWYGAPGILGSQGSNMLVYPDEGLAFVVSLEDQNTISFVIIRSPGSDGGIRSFMSVAPCDGPARLCSIATATPTA